jgi:imidazole glycerol phosphate synthase subunit HisF
VSFRICVSVLLNQDGVAIQSYNFKTRRVLGNISQVMNFLDKYEADEVHIIIPLKKARHIDSYKTLLKLRNISISTPIGIGGGITSKNIKVITKDPFFERLIFNTALFDNDAVLEEATSIMGRQSMVAYIPFKIINKVLQIYNAKLNKFVIVEDFFWKKIEIVFNEIILLDALAEGSRIGFNFKVFDLINFPIDRVLISGGLTKIDIKKARKINLAGVSLDNFALYSEFSLKRLR